jgi:hypothetical protein
MIRPPAARSAVRLFEDDPLQRIQPVAFCLPLLMALAACSSAGEFDETGGVRVVRSACPAVGVPAYTGDITVFDPPESREARAIDVVATITNVRGGCSDSGDMIQATASFDVLARRSVAGPARDVVLPYYATVVRGGTQVVSKQISRVSVHFNDGELRARSSGSATASVARAAATVPADIQERITRKRKPTDADASIDPMADPAVRAAVQKASFELLVGFQLSEAQLAYNATR